MDKDYIKVKVFELDTKRCSNKTNSQNGRSTLNAACTYKGM